MGWKGNAELSKDTEIKGDEMPVENYDSKKGSSDFTSSFSSMARLMANSALEFRAHARRPTPLATSLRSMGSIDVAWSVLMKHGKQEAWAALVLRCKKKSNKLSEHHNYR